MSNTPLDLAVIQDCENGICDTPALLAELEAWRSMAVTMLAFLKASGTTDRDHSWYWDMHGELSDQVAALLPDRGEA